MARPKNVTTLYKKLSKAHDVVHESRLAINNILEKKFDNVYIDHNESDGIILVHHDEMNTPVSSDILEAILNDKTTVEQTMEYLKENAV